MHGGCVDAKEAKELATTSGNSFQCRVAQYFRQRNWATLLSPYYVDAFTGKPRESDLLVEKSFPVHNIFNGPPVSVRVRLFIECKYILDGAVFWMEPKDLAATRNWIFGHTPLIDHHLETEKHHYLANTGPVAKLFATDSKKSEDNDPIFRALNQCLQGYVNNRTRASLVDTLGNEEVHTLSYPVIVCSDFDNFYGTDIANPGDPTPIERNFMMELNYAYQNFNAGMVREYFLVDVVDANRLDEFLKSLETEVAVAQFMVMRN